MPLTTKFLPQTTNIVAVNYMPVVLNLLFFKLCHVLLTKSNQIMRKITLLLIVIVSTLCLQAQDVKEILQKTTQNIDKKEYQKALENLELVKKHIEDMLVSELVNDLLPDKVLAYEATQNSTENISYIKGYQKQITKTYLKAQEKPSADTEGDYTESQNITIVITNNTGRYCEAVNQFNMGASMSGEMDLNMNLQAFYHNGYRALSRFEEGGYRNLFIIAGAAVIEVSGGGFSNKEELNQIVSSLSFEEIIETFGK